MLDGWLGLVWGLILGVLLCLELGVLCCVIFDSGVNGDFCAWVLSLVGIMVVGFEFIVGLVRCSCSLVFGGLLMCALRDGFYTGLLCASAVDDLRVVRGWHISLC